MPNRVKEALEQQLSSGPLLPRLKIDVFCRGQQVRTIEVEDPREVICRAINDLDSEFTAKVRAN